MSRAFLSSFKPNTRHKVSFVFFDETMQLVGLKKSTLFVILNNSFIKASKFNTNSNKLKSKITLRLLFVEYFLRMFLLYFSSKSFKRFQKVFERCCSNFDVRKVRKIRKSKGGRKKREIPKEKTETNKKSNKGFFGSTIN